MKRIFAVLVVLMAVFAFAQGGFADGTGVQMIGVPQQKTQPVIMDDIHKGDSVDIPGYGTVTFDSMEFVDEIDCGFKYGWHEEFEEDSESDYLRIRFKILNTQKQPVNFLDTIDGIVCSFGDGYKFGGWYRQETLCSDGKYYPYHDEDKHDDVGVLYDCYFDIIVTLPNYVVTSEEPLSVTFKLGNSEFTYHHRK